MTIIACVLRSGGIYGGEHVNRLGEQLSRFAIDRGFICLTDIVDLHAPMFDEIVPLKHRWPGWFSKIELFAMPGPVLYLDLDVSIIGDLAPLLKLAETVDFAMCQGFWGAEDPNPRNSSIMAWRANAPAHLYELFTVAPEAFCKKHSVRNSWGDQGFIATHYGAPIPAIQDLLPGMVCSFKRGALMGEDLKDARIICSHGEPRPWAHGGADQWLAARGFIRFA